MLDPVTSLGAALGSFIESTWALFALGLLPLVGLAAEKKKKGLGCLGTALISVVVLVVLVVGGLYAFRGPISEKILTTLDQELSKQGIYLTYQAGDFNVLKGLTLEDVTLYRTEKQEEKVMHLSKVAIGYNLFSVLSDLDNASANLSTNDAVLTLFHEGEGYPVEKLTGNIDASAAKMSVNSMKGEFASLRLDVAGEVELSDPNAAPVAAPDKGEPKPSELPEEPEAKPSPIEDLDLSPVKMIAAELARLEAKKDPPTLEARFKQNYNGPLELKGSLRGKEFSFDGLPIDSLDLDFVQVPESNPIIVEFPNAKAVYDGRPLTMKGKLDTGAQVLTIEELDSQVDLLSLAKTFNKELDTSMVRFSTPPQVNLSGSIPINEPEKMAIQGRATSKEGITVLIEGGKSLLLSDVKTDFSLADGLLSLSNTNASTLGGKGTLVATLTPFAEPMIFDGTLSVSQLAIKEIASLGGLEGMEKGEVAGSFTGKGAPGLTTLNGTGQLAITDSELPSLPIFRKLAPIIKVISAGTLSKGATANANYALNKGILTSDDIKVAAGLLTVDGTADVDFGKEYVNSATAVINAGPGGFISQLSGQTIEGKGSGPFDKVEFKVTKIPGVPGIPSLGGVGPENLMEVIKSGKTGIGAVDKIGERNKETIDKIGDAINSGSTEDIVKEGLRMFGLGGDKEDDEEKDSEKEEDEKEEKPKEE